MKKILSVIAILFFLLLAGLGIYVQSDAFTERIRSSIVEQVRAVLGPEARIGHVKANLLPPYLELRDIVIPDARGKDAVAVRKIKIYLNPVPLILKKIRIPSISVLEPRIYLERAPDGAINMTPLIERIRANIAGTGKTSSFKLLLKKITISKGEIRFNDDGLSSRASITGLDMTARFNLASDRVSLSVRASHVVVSAPAIPELTGGLKASADYEPGRVRLKSFELATGDTTVTAKGETGLTPDSALDLRGTLRSGPQSLRRLTEIFRPGRRPPSPQVEASFAITGKVSDPKVRGGFRFSGITYEGIMMKEASLTYEYHDRVLAVRGGTWTGTIQGKALAVDRIHAELALQEGVLDIKDAEFGAGDLDVRAHGTADQKRGLDVELAIRSAGQGKTLSLLGSIPVEGEIAVNGRLTGAQNVPVLFDGTLAAGPVRVRGVQFDRVQGNLKYHDRRISLESVGIERQSSRYVFDGTADFSRAEPAYTARLRVIRSDVVSIVALFYKSLPLSLSARGELTFQGTTKNYSGSGSLSLDAGSAYGETFTGGSLTASLSTGKIAFPQAVLYKKKGMVRATGWIGFDGTYSADLESRGIALSSVDHLTGAALDGGADLDLHSSGSFSKPVAAASIDVSEFSVRGVVMGKLHAAAEMKDGQIKGTADLPEDAARLSFQWNLRAPYAWTAAAKIRTDGINPLLLLGNADLAERVKVIAVGSVNARGNGLDRSSIVGEAVFSHLAAVMGDYRIDSESEPDFTINGSKLTIKSLNMSGPATRISMAGTTDILSNVNITVKGTANLPLLKLLFPEVELAAGSADMTLTVTDEWNNPDVSGSLRIRDGEIKILDVPQKFTALNGSIIFSQGRITTDAFTGELGGGSLGISGWVQLAGFAIQEFSVKSAVDNVTVRYPAGLTSTLSGNLYYDGSVKEKSLSGDITIKRARYDKPIEWKSMLVEFGRGLYQKKKTSVGWIGDSQLNVRFHGSENILFQNNLAKIPLDVDVFLRGTVNHPQLLGRIEAAKGTVYFRRNDFNILHAAVDFVDPNRMNPVLDIQAETQVREYDIQLGVTGTAERAVVTFVSDPPLAEADILGLLTTGRKGTELKGKEANVGVSEAVSVATGQVQDILARRTQSLTGLDRFQVDPYVDKSDTSVPRVTVGKELIQNRLYITYSSNVGATAPEQTLRIEYILNKHFSLVGARDEASSNGADIGADIKYRFEFQ